MTTISNKKVKLPLRKDCRVDNVFVGGRNYSCLVDYINNETIYTELGVAGIGNLYSNFKFAAINELPINTAHYLPLTHPFKQIENVNYCLY